MNFPSGDESLKIFHPIFILSTRLDLAGGLDSPTSQCFFGTSVEIEDPQGNFLRNLQSGTRLNSIAPDGIQLGRGLKIEDRKAPRNLQSRARLNSIALDWTQSGLGLRGLSILD